MTTPTGIVIGATPGAEGEAWVKDLKASFDYIAISQQYPITTNWTWDFELDSIALGAQLYEEFIFLPMSTEVLDDSIFAICFEKYRGMAVSLSQNPKTFGYYMGKYRSIVVQRLDIPIVHSKIEAVRLETEWTAQYVAADPTVVCIDNIPESRNFVEKYGRNNMVAEGKYFRRFKSCWDMPSALAEQDRLRAIRS